MREPQHPLIEPDVRFSRIRLSEHLARRGRCHIQHVERIRRQVAAAAAP
jgi:hypothetical protein